MNDQQIEDLIAFLSSIKLTPTAAKAQAAQYGTDGKALFENYCARCHTEGWSYGEPGIAGGGAFGFALNDGRAARQFPTVQQQIDWISNTADLGKPYGARGVSHGLMPHFADLLSDDQIRAIVDYERSL
jgi:mono/diheme cytochrome c family protein